MRILNITTVTCSAASTWLSAACLATPPHPQSAYTAAQARQAAESHAPVAEREFRDCSDCPVMVAVPPGAFWMGSPPTEEDRIDDELQHRVAIPAPFALAKTEITFDQWDACAEAGYCRPVPNTDEGDRGWGRGSRPVIEVSWNDITGADGRTRGFLAWLGAKTGTRYRLPTEIEWEYAARGNASGSANEPPFYFGPDRAQLCRHEYTFVCIRDDPGTAPVAQFPANPFGLHDMLGNVAEWVEDCYAPYSEAPALEPHDEGCSRVVRGGSWVYYLWFSRAAVRDRDGPANRNDHRGFRVARSLDGTGLGR